MVIGFMAHRIIIPDLNTLEILAASIALEACRGDLIALQGPLGAGKTEFVRRFLSAQAHRVGVSPPREVPSPTFTLCQTYQIGAEDYWHYDLYRINTYNECIELGFEDALEEGVVLVEWPDRLGPLLPNNRLVIDLSISAEEYRVASITGYGSWEAKTSSFVAQFSESLLEK